MKTLKIGIAGYDRMRARAVATARGEHEPAGSEPTVRFISISIEIFTEVLSQRNRELLAMIAQKKPDSLTELADLAEQNEWDLSQALEKMSRLGLVDLKEGRCDTPRVPYDRIILDTQSVIEMLLRRIFERRRDSE